MVRHGRPFTTFAILWAVLQIALPPGMSFLDAMLARGDDSRTAVSHVEETSSKSCRPVHSGECTICRDISQLLGLNGSPAPVAWTFAGRFAPDGESPRRAESDRIALPPSRAPPLA